MIRTCEICGVDFETLNKKKRTCSQSCLCKLRIDITTAGEHNLKHGFARKDCVERLHGIWRGIIKRCYCTTHESYQNYGARGIIICDEWKTNYVAFRDWFYSVGGDSTLTIDRIDNSGPYSPANCKLSTAKEQARNRRTSRVLEYKGASKTLAEWSELLGIPYARIFARISKLGWSIEDAFEKDKLYNPHIQLK